jgi:hypothetical protein
MKPEFDREVEALLRGHARRGGARAGVPDARAEARGGGAAHLDADELGAFAENALPEAARARYASHLADCGACRRVVTGIALASGAAEQIARREPASAAAPASVSWRERLAALFAPGAWRYAMPVVALLAVGAVALVLMRRVPEPGASVSREQPGAGARTASPAISENREIADARQQAQSAPPQQPAAAGAQPSSPAANTSGASEADSPGRARPAEPSGPVTITGGGVGGSGAAPQAAAERQVTELAAAPPPMQATTVPAQPAKPAAADAARDESKQANKSEVAEREERAGTRRKEATQSDETSTASRAAQREAQRPSPVPFAVRPGAGGESQARAGATAGRAQQQSPAEGSQRARRERDDDSGETRRAGGRTFRRARGAWVDTAYDSSQATVVVRYDSEQYRALLGDEPALGRIVGSLGGEIIVVWKGRAYHFK